MNWNCGCPGPTHCPHLGSLVAQQRQRIAELEVALGMLVNCIDTSAADDGPLVARGSSMATVCRVLQRTTQYDLAKAALKEPA